MMQGTIIREASNAVRIYGRHAAKKDGVNLWFPVRDFIISSGLNHEGNWSANHISGKKLGDKNPFHTLERRAKKGDRLSYYLFKHYSIPQEERCNVVNVLKLSYYMGMYDKKWEEEINRDKNYYNILYDKHDLGNLNRYITNRGLLFPPNDFVVLMRIIHDEVLNDRYH